MKKKHLHHHRVAVAHKTAPKEERYLVVIRSWMLIVLFALMLGTGVILGNFFNQKLNGSPQVAGVQIQAK